MALLKRTSLEIELDLISALERGEVVSQADLFRRLSVSVGLINTLLKRVIRKGMVKANAAPCPRWVYYLTLAGLAEKGRLVARYLETSLVFFRKARQEYGKLFTELRQAGLKEAVLVGHGGLAEIAILAARESGIFIVGLMHTEANEDRYFGIPIVRRIDSLTGRAALVITASRDPQAVYDGLRREVSNQIVRAPSLLRISARAGPRRC